TLLQFVRVMTERCPYDFVRVVLGSAEGDCLFVEVEDNDNLRFDLQDGIGRGQLALGLLGWELGENSFKARSLIFPWYEEDQVARQLFREICEKGVDSVQNEHARSKRS